jgi:tRNA 2-selenouridine synthase
LLLQLHGRAVIERWKEMAQQGQWNDLVRELLERHYDPAYTRSIGSHYPGLALAPTVEIASYTDAAFVSAARAMLDATSAS